MLLISLPYFYMSFLGLWISTGIIACMRASVWYLVHATYSSSVVCLYALSLKVLYYICCNALKYLCYVLTIFCTCLEKLKPMLFSQSLPSCWVDNLHIIWHVHFISNQNFFDVWNCMLFDLLEPVLDIIECSLVRDIINKEYTHSTFVVRLSNCSESFLSSCIPHL